MGKSVKCFLLKLEDLDSNSQKLCKSWMKSLYNPGKVRAHTHTRIYTCIYSFCQQVVIASLRQPCVSLRRLCSAGTCQPALDCLKPLHIFLSFVEKWISDCRRDLYQIHMPQRCRGPRASSGSLLQFIVEQMDICALQLGEQVQKSQTHLHVQLSRWRTTVGAWLVREEGIEFLAQGYQDNICSLPDINLMCLLVQALSWAQGYYNKENKQGSYLCTGKSKEGQMPRNPGIRVRRTRK